MKCSKCQKDHVCNSKIPEVDGRVCTTCFQRWRKTLPGEAERLRKVQRDRYQKNPTPWLQGARNLRVEHPEIRMFRAAKARAKKLQLDFDLTPEDIVIPTHCPVFGFELKRTEGVVGPASPSLDRIDSSKGYVKGNIQVISWRANDLKGNATLEELQRLVQFWTKQQ